MADIFDEVSEELKQDQLIKTWKKYSKLGKKLRFVWI